MNSMEHGWAVGAFQAWGCAVGPYLIGCFATGYYLVRARTGQDIREIGSGSSGARNVGRVLGGRGFGLTLLGDLAKGALAVWAARRFTESNLLAAVALLSVVAGHLWPVTLRWRGGKGVATSLGALVVYDAHLALAYFGCALFALALVRKITPAGMAAYLCLPVVSYWLHRHLAEASMLAMLAGMVIFAHRQNLRGTDSISGSPVNPKAPKP